MEVTTQEAIEQGINPVTFVRERLGLSRLKLALRTGCGYALMGHAETGVVPQLPPSVVSALEREGLPKEDADRMYTSFRVHLRAQLQDLPAGERSAEAVA